MLVKDYMRTEPYTVMPNDPVSIAYERMYESHIRHLPVVSVGNHLEGFLTLADLKQGLIPSMVSDLSLQDLMIKNPITVDPDEEIEYAARLIYKHKIGGVPVTKRNKLVGIITATDLLRTFIDMMGILSGTSRIDVAIGDRPDAFKKVLQIINDSGGDIINVGMTRQENKRVYYFRLSACETAGIKAALEKEKFEVLAALD